MTQRETALRTAFTGAVRAILASPKPVQNPSLVKRVVRVIEAGAGIRSPRPR